MGKDNEARGGNCRFAPCAIGPQEQSSNISINASFPLGIFSQRIARYSPETPIAV